MDFKRLIRFSLVFVIFIFVSAGHSASAPRAIVCEQAYALCTFAPCQPDTKNLHRSICNCVVQKGKSAGFTSCEKRKPYKDQEGIHLVSTFSFEQFAAKKSLNCPSGMPWSNCVDMPCRIDPQNPAHAICVCELNTTQAFFTFGGNCDSHTCASGYWSGATKGANSDALRDALNKDSVKQVSPEACPKNLEK